MQQFRKKYRPPFPPVTINLVNFEAQINKFDSRMTITKRHLAATLPRSSGRHLRAFVRTTRLFVVYQNKTIKSNNNFIVTTTMTKTFIILLLVYGEYFQVFFGSE